MSLLSLDFSDFIDRLEVSRKTHGEDHRRLHFYEGEEAFYLYLRSPDFWEYSSVVPKDALELFGLEYDNPREEAIKDFRVNVLYDGIRMSERVGGGVVNVIEQSVGEIVEKNKVEEGIIYVEEEEAKDYVDFLRKRFDSWEKKILGFIDSTLSDELLTKSLLKHEMSLYVEKGFGDFLSRLFNTVHTAGFLTALAVVIRVDVKAGMEDAEEELGVDIGVTQGFEDHVDFLANRQLEGFHVGDGRWNGLKGVSADVQKEIAEIVRKGVADKESLKDMKNSIKGAFDRLAGDDGEITEGRAMAIARTETNRFRNGGKLQAYKDSGVVKSKRWKKAPIEEERHTQICKNLHGQVVLLNDPFVDPGTNLQYDAPPAHVNCLSSIQAILRGSKD